MSTALTITPQRPLLVVGRRVIYGAVVCVFSLNGVLRLIAVHWQGTRWGTALLSVAAIPDSIYGTIRGGPFLLFELLFRWVLFLLAVYFLLLIVGSLRHKSPTVFASGMAGFLLGLFALTWLSILVFVLFLLVALIGGIIWLIHLVFTAILSFLLWPPVLYTLLTLIAIPIIVGLISLIRGISFTELWSRIKEWLSNLSARPIVFALGLLALAAFIWFVGIPLWQYYIAPILAAIREWLVQYVLPILSWIGTVLFALIAGIILLFLIVGILFALGWQFAEQFSSARFCGRNTHTLFEAGFAVGAVLGLALLVCLSNPNFRSLVNVSWSDASPLLSSLDLSAAVYSLMPAKAEGLLQAAFSKASIPIFDLASLVATLLLVNSSLITSLVAGVTVEPLRELLRRERLPPLGKLLFGFVLMFAVAVVASVAGEDT